MAQQGLSKKGPITRSSATDVLALPAGTTTNDLLYWNQSAGKWVVLAAPSASGTKILASVSGTLTWVDVINC